MDNQSEQVPQPLPAESLPVTPAQPEQAPAPHSIEKAPQKAAETAGSRINQQPSSPAQAAPLVLPPVVTPAPTVSDDTDASTTNVSSPAVADDVDVIEKEWVDKAKQIVNETKGDPYVQEKSVEQLQRAYLKKRYNKELGES